MIKKLNDIAKGIITKTKADIKYLDNNDTNIYIRRLFYIKHICVYALILKIIDKLSYLIINLVYSPRLKGYEHISVFCKLFDIIYERTSKMYDIKICNKPEIIWDEAPDGNTVIGCGVILDDDGELTDEYVVVCYVPNMIKYLSKHKVFNLNDASYHFCGMILNSIFKSNDIYNGIDYKQQQARRIEEYTNRYNINFDIIDLCKFIINCRKLIKSENHSSDCGFYK